MVQNMKTTLHEILSLLLVPQCTESFAMLTYKYYEGFLHLWKFIETSENYVRQTYSTLYILVHQH
jgi:hypothetical protein